MTTNISTKVMAPASSIRS